jgi:exopolysaccharide biosynthesis polyprenyl glycosylphosphotransferase
VPLGAIVPGSDILTLGGLVIVTRLHPLAVSYALLAFVFLAWTGTQRSRINPRLSDDLPYLIAPLAAPALLLALFAHSDTELGAFIRVIPVAIALVLVGRGLAYMIVREARARGFVLEPTLIVGAGKIGEQAATTLQEHSEYGLYPIGFLDSFDDTDLPLPILGDTKELEPIVREFGVRRVIVAFGATREPEMVKIIRACDRLPVEVHVIPRFFELGVAPEGPWTDDLWGIPVMRLRRSALRTVAWRTKRMFDLVVATFMLVGTGPIFGICALGVKLSSPGPIFFKQKRIGQRGEVFETLKFRTLRVNEDSDVTWTVAEDERRTAFGSFLRRSSLDELPQLINVLRGEMSLVGPRPERPFFVDRFRVAVPRYDDRHRVPAGLTGWAQVHGLRGDTSIPERALFDNHYVEHWSLWRDIVIMLRTVTAVLKGSGQ